MEVVKKQQGKEKHDASINHFAERQYQLLISSQIDTLSQKNLFLEQNMAD